MSAIDLPVCIACGSQYDSPDGSAPSNCKICDDPRQFVPPEGQLWTTLSEIKKTHKNIIRQDEVDPHVWNFETEPKFAIGQRCFLIETPEGNVLWDIICLIDDTMIDFIKSKGGLKFIAISHPHYYTTYAEYARIFNCPIYVGADDQEWVCQKPYTPEPFALMHGPAGERTSPLPGVSVIKCGGHFPGSLMLHYQNKLFIADSIVTTPSAYSPHPRPPAQISYVFQYSIPNTVPLPPWEIQKIWESIKDLSFDTTHGAFTPMDIRGDDVKARVLYSMKFQIRAEGYENHEFLNEKL